MTRLVSFRAGIGFVVLSLVAFISFFTGPSARADAVPFTDPNAHGYIGLCDSAGHSITSGRLSDKPFVVRAVSSVPAPVGYQEKQGAKATLYAYQPINGIDPGDWSGQQMNGSSFFSNNAHPMAEGTVLDYSMGDFVELYPPKWENLVQLRLFYGAPNKSTYIDSYPATVLKIEGNSWHVVQGGSVDCTAGKVVTTERLLLPKSKFASASASIAAPGGATLGGVSHRNAATGDGKAASTVPDDAPTASGAPAPSGKPSASPARDTRSASISPAAHSTSASDAGASSVWLIVLTIAGLGILGVAGAWVVRRRATS